jgi:hypothetical protein
VVKAAVAIIAAVVALARPCGVVVRSAEAVTVPTTGPTSGFGTVRLPLALVAAMAFAMA